MPIEKSMNTMELWKLLRSRPVFILRLFVRLALCFIAAFLTFTLLAWYVPENIIWNPPIRMVKHIINAFYPSVIIDGETAYDVIMGDSFAFYGGIAFLCYFYLSYKMYK